MTALPVDFTDLAEVTCAGCGETTVDLTVCHVCQARSCACDRTVDCDSGLTFCTSCCSRCLCRECGALS